MKFAEKSYIDREYFLAEAKKWLKDKDFLMLSQVSINIFQPHYKDSKVLRDYKNFEQTLRREIASFRISKGAGVFTSGGKINPELNFESGLNLNLSEGTPLEIEIRLLKVRWQFIENLEGGHIFDLEALILYFLKLQIQKRLFTFNKEKGEAIFDELSAITL